MIPHNKTRVILIPLSWVFGLIQRGRNLLFDTGLISGEKANIRTIVVGNLAVGGTGKTPHVIWLAKELSKTHNLAILSRGYGRKSKGFRWVLPDDHYLQTGDEPLEMKIQLPNIPVAVDSNRLRAIKRMHSELKPHPDFIILDDGFQHRRLIPDYALILSHAGKPFFSDHLMPAGRLREPASSISRASSLIITSCDEELREEKLNLLRKLSGLKESQNIFSSTFRYLEPTALNEKAKLKTLQTADAILLVTGIAWSGNLPREMEAIAPSRIMNFRDHHKYTKKDIRSILSNFNLLKGENKVLVTTGKDAVKLMNFPELKQIPMFRIERQVVMAPGQMKNLFESILNNG